MTRVAMNNNLGSKSVAGAGSFETLEARRLLSVAALRTLAATGLPTGDLPGVNFNHVFTPVINDAGQVAYVSNLLGPGYFSFDRAIWRSTVDPLNPAAPPTRGLIAVAGGQAPDAGGATYSSFGANHNVNDDGQVTFHSQLTGGDVNSDNDTAQYVGTPGAVVERFREGDPAPGTSPGVVYNDSIFGNGPPRLGDGGVVGQSVDVRGTGVSTFNDVGIVAGTLGGPQQFVAREGDPAPGTPSGDYSFYTMGLPVTNDDGAVVFDTYLYDELTGLPTSFRTIWLRTPDGQLRSATFPGMPLPDVGPSATLGGAFSPALNGAGQIAFHALFNDPANTASDRGLFVGTPDDGYRLVARNFQPAPGLAAGVTISLANSTPLINAQGQVVFSASLLGSNAGITSNNNETVWLWSPVDRSLTLAWREGETAPSAPAGVVFGPLLQSPAVNAEGQVLVYSQLRNSGGINDRGLYATEADGLNVFKVVMEGDVIQVAPGDARTVTFIEVQTDSGGEDGRRTGINDAGQVAFRALFESSSSGAFVADTRAPAPAAPTGEGGFSVDASAVPLSFSQSVLADLSAGDLVVTNSATGQVTPATVLPSGALGASVAIPTTLADGDYRLTVRGDSVADPFGRRLDGNADGSPGDDLLVDFFIFAGDADRDRAIDINDFAILASRFNLPGTFSQADFDYSGVTDIGDFAILASNFNTSLPAARAAISIANGTHSSAVEAVETRTLFAVSRIGESVLQDVELIS